MIFRKLPVVLLLLLTAVQVQAGPDGRALYQEHCNACHQVQGKSGIGLPLTTEILRDVGDDYLFKTIRHGRPGRVMHGFQALSDAQVNAIVRHLRERSGSKGPTFDPAPLAGDASRAQELYAEHCQKCHGADGNGEGKGTGVTSSRKRSFPVMPSDIANPGFQASASDRLIRHIILVGREDSDMPAFGKKGLTEQQLDDLVAYIRMLGQRALESVPEQADDEEISHVYESPYDFKTTVENVKQAIIGYNFRIFPDRFLEQGLIDEFSVNQKQVGIRFCNFKELYGMIAIEPRLGVVLPCRVTIMERDDGQVILVAPNLRVVSRWFNNDELVRLWESMEETFVTIIEEATL